MPLKLKKKGKIWHVTGTIDGRRIRESTGTANREHAEAHRRELERDIEERVYKKDSACWAEAMNFYIEKRGIGEKPFLTPLLERFGAMKLKDITPVVVSNYVQDNLGHLEPSSVKRVFYTPMNAVMRAAFRAQLCPLIRFEPPKVKPVRIEYADDQWLRLFLENARPRIAIAVLFMTLTGARVSEVCRIAARDIDLEQGFAILRKTKNGKSRRAILPPLLVEPLRLWMLETKALEAGTPVFGYSGRWSVNQAIERVCDRVNLAAGSIRFDKVLDAASSKKRVVRVVLGPLALEYLSSHQVGRHAFAARLLADGQSLKVVMEAGGWSGIQIVNEAYGHLERSHIDKALRETGDGMITKLGSALPMLPSPKHSGQEIGTNGEVDPLLEAIKRRVSLEKSGAWDGGR